MKRVLESLILLCYAQVFLKEDNTLGTKYLAVLRMQVSAKIFLFDNTTTQGSLF